MFAYKAKSSCISTFASRNSHVHFLYTYSYNRQGILFWQRSARKTINTNNRLCKIKTFFLQKRNDDDIYDDEDDKHIYKKTVNDHHVYFFSLVVPIIYHHYHHAIPMIPIISIKAADTVNIVCRPHSQPTIGRHISEQNIKKCSSLNNDDPLSSAHDSQLEFISKPDMRGV